MCLWAAWNCNLYATGHYSSGWKGNQQEKCGHSWWHLWPAHMCTGKQRSVTRIGSSRSRNCVLERRSWVWAWVLVLCLRLHFPLTCDILQHTNYKVASLLNILVRLTPVVIDSTITQTILWPRCCNITATVEQLTFVDRRNTCTLHLEGQKGSFLTRRGHTVPCMPRYVRFS